MLGIVAPGLGMAVVAKRDRIVDLARPLLVYVRDLDVSPARLPAETAMPIAPEEQLDLVRFLKVMLTTSHFPSPPTPRSLLLTRGLAFDVQDGSVLFV
jgi:hypothetical protein